MDWDHGIDKSHWQRPALRDAQAESASGDKFVWIKASDGAGASDQAMAAHYANYQGLMARGAYHFYRFGSSPEANLAKFMHATAGRTWELPHALDAEKGGAGSPRATADALLFFLEHLEAAIGRIPACYVGGPWFRATVEADPRFERYPLWLPRYPNAYKDGHRPAPGIGPGPLPAPWGDFTVWQYSDTNGTKDRNVTTKLSSLTTTKPPQEGPPMADAVNDKLDRLLASNARIEAALATVDRKAAVVRDPRDKKAWVVDEDGRWHVPNRKVLDTLILIGQVAGLHNGEIPVADPAWLDAIPARPTPELVKSLA